MTADRLVYVNVRVYIDVREFRTGCLRAEPASTSCKMTMGLMDKWLGEAGVTVCLRPNAGSHYCTVCAVRITYPVMVQVQGCPYTNSEVCITDSTRKNSH